MEFAILRNYVCNLIERDGSTVVKSLRTWDFYSSHELFWIQCRRMETFMIKQIPLCYILTNFERSINAEQYMCNTEKKILGRIQEIRF